MRCMVHVFTVYVSANMLSFLFDCLLWPLSKFETVIDNDTYYLLNMLTTSDECDVLGSMCNLYFFIVSAIACNVN